MKKCRDLTQDLQSNPIKRESNKFIDVNTKVFTIGSCFALEIKDFLMRNSYNVLVPEETSSTPEPRLIWYNTYTILYEFQRITGEFVQKEDDVWDLGNRWQDPYRRCVFGDTKEDLWKKINKLNEDIKFGILNSECLVITLGLTEVFFNGNSAICSTPGYAGGGGHECVFRPTKFNENYDNVKKIVEILKNINPNCRIILTVSPVPLGMTFRDLDHLIANTESKSILRTVAGQIQEEYPDIVNYFHSFEISSNSNREAVYMEDARHVRRDFVEGIMSEFKKYFIK
jgi:hypothetical protein